MTFRKADKKTRRRRRQKENVVKEKKRKYVPSSVKATNSVLLWLETYEKKKIQRERERELERQRREDERHDQKMNFYERLLDKF